MKKLSLYIFLVLFFCNTLKAESSLPECKGDNYKSWTNCLGNQKLPNEIKYEVIISLRNKIKEYETDYIIPKALRIM